MKFIETEIPGVVLIEPQTFEDPRGFFFESYHQGKFADGGIREVFVQDNHSLSTRGTLRGLHYQLHHPQAKLCRVTRGEVFDVAVDIRKGSPTFGKSVCATLSAENKRQLFIPKGFAHGFCVLSETAQFLYKCSDFYRPEDECGIAWNDPYLSIRWPVEKPFLSDKDLQLPFLKDQDEKKIPVYGKG
ncbi:MAG: dTDP-4-dehydrorhamnose 3,5-epimerase [bacterium]